MRQAGQTEQSSGISIAWPSNILEKIWNEDTWWRRTALYYFHCLLLTLPLNTFISTFILPRPGSQSFPLPLPPLCITFVNYAMPFKCLLLLLPQYCHSFSLFLPSLGSPLYFPFHSLSLPQSSRGQGNLKAQCVEFGLINNFYIGKSLIYSL